jgi:hypothetical protein
VLDIGSKFFVLALVGDGIRFDGFECLRISDLRRLAPDPYAPFAEAALKKRGERLPATPRVDVSGVAELLLTANRAFPLVTIHRERINPDSCWIGRVVGIDRGVVSLLQIGPDAIWGERPEKYRLSEITRVDFGGSYEQALHLVGGDPHGWQGNGHQ